MPIAFQKQSWNFFGPNVKDEALKSPISLEVVKLDHRVLSCNQGIERIKIIDKMARAIVQSEERPNWLRRNGSIKRDELQKSFGTLPDKFLTDKEFVSLDGLHFFNREEVKQASKMDQDNFEDIKCPTCRHKYKQRVFSPTLALFVKMRNNFNPKAYPALYGRKELEKTDDSSFWFNAALVTLFAVACIGTFYYTGYLSLAWTSA